MIATPSRPARNVAPRRGGVADRETGRAELSTAPVPRGGERLLGFGAVPAWVVVVGGLAFLLGRPGLHGVRFGVPLLLAGYLTWGGAALVVGQRHARQAREAPLGWGVPLGIGVAAMPVDLGAALLLSWQRYASGRWTVPAVTHAVANLLAVT